MNPCVNVSAKGPLYDHGLCSTQSTNDNKPLFFPSGAVVAVVLEQADTCLPDSVGCERCEDHGGGGCAIRLGNNGRKYNATVGS